MNSFSAVVLLAVIAVVAVLATGCVFHAGWNLYDHIKAAGFHVP